MAQDLLAGLSAAQTEAVTAVGPVAVIAGPGSGKTRTLTRRVAYRCQQGHADPARTLVLTFSRRAASELLARLGRLGVPAGPRSGGVVAGTFHAVAWAELSRHRAERGLAPVAILGRPARLIAPALRETTGRDPWPGEAAAVAREFSGARAAGRTPTGAVWDAYLQAKRHRRVLDLDDLLEHCLALLTEDRAAAEAARWRHRHIAVDEYQDLNAAHLALLRAFVAGRDDICLVGDPDQSIYGFNGSLPDLFTRLDTDWPGTRLIRLDDNYRSSPEIVAVSGVLGAAGTSRRPPGPVPQLTAYADADAEAEAIAADIASRRSPGRSWSAMAVLARTNARLRPVAAALTAAGVPWRMHDPRPLADQPDVHAVLEGLAPTAPASMVETDELPALGAALAEYRLIAPEGTVRSFRSWLDATGITADDGMRGGVELATCHRAKGLEWSSVWLAGADELGDSAEERRLLFVAVTRAEEELAVSWAGEAPAGVVSLTAAQAGLLAAPSPTEQRRRLAELRTLLAAS